MSPNSIQKLKAAALYILNSTGKIGYYTLFKIMYFAEMKHLSIYGRPITEDDYVAMDHGPVPSALYDAIKGQQYPAIYSDLQFSSRYEVKATAKADMDELSDSDIECLNESIDENKDLPFGVLREKSHGYAYKEAKSRSKASNNPIATVDIAKEGGANNDMLAYISEMQELESFLANGAQYC